MPGSGCGCSASGCGPAAVPLVVRRTRAIQPDGIDTVLASLQFFPRKKRIFQQNIIFAANIMETAQLFFNWRIWELERGEMLCQLKSQAP